MDRAEQSEERERRRRPWEVLLSVILLIFSVIDQRWWAVVVLLVLIAINVPGLVRDTKAILARRRENPASPQDKRRFRRDVLIGMVIVLVFVVAGAVQEAIWWLSLIAIAALSVSALLLWRNVQRNEG